MAEINEVKLNGQTILSTRSNTVTEDTLVQGETAQNKAGESIVGRLDPVDKDKAYLISDEIGEIDNADYMPFYDTSEQKKKKTLFGSIVEKLKSVFAQKTDLKAHTYEVGTEIPENADLNNYTTAGVYKIAPDATASTISNIPIAHGGKLIVMEGVSNAETYKMQLFIEHEDNYYTRRTTGSAWSNWKQLASTDDIAPSTVGNGYAVGTVSGSAITATISGFKLRAGVIVALHISSDVTVDCTLNINNTGAKSVKTWNGEAINFGHQLSFGIHVFIYDGTYYRIIAQNRTPLVGVQSYVADTSGSELIEWGYGNNRAQIKHNIGSNKLVWNYYKNSAWRGDVKIADYDDLGATVAKVGKNILPSWSFSTNVLVNNGITYTFNPTTGEITANGTATAISTCIIAGTSTPYYYYIPKGEYILTGCPSGGSASTYYISVQYSYIDSPSTMSSILDTGSGATVTLEKDIYCNASKNHHYYIFVASGQTVSNLVFKPMLRPAFTTADFEPCEDIHKGNCYVGTCTTAGATKDKVAYVDGYFVLRKGVRVAIKFTNTNTYSNVTTSPITLNVNGTGAKNIWYGGSHSGAGITGTMSWVYGSANQYFKYVYDGTYWVWEGCGVDNNSTNFLRNDASSTLTASSPYICLKASNIDITQANNGVTSHQYPAFFLQDKNGQVTSRFESIIDPNGDIHTYVYARNYKTSDGTYHLGGIRITANKSGNIGYTLTNPHNFNVALGCGYGTCDTAESTTAKVVTLADYVLVKHGYVSVKFTYAVPANSTMNINSKGAKNIWYRGANITANVIKAGDLATFIYDGTRYHLVGIDRDSEETVISTSNCTHSSKLPVTSSGWYVDGHLFDGHLLFLKLEHRFKPTEDVTFTGNEAVYTISGYNLGGNYFLWHDVQAYINYSTIRPMGLYNNGNNLEIRFRGGMPSFSAGSDNTLRLTFVTYVNKV